MIERSMLACGGPGARTAAAADLVASTQDPVEVEVVRGNEAETGGAGLIAMSRRPRSRLRHASTGNVSPAVVMRAGCPVVVVREPGFRV